MSSETVIVFVKYDCLISQVLTPGFGRRSHAVTGASQSCKQVFTTESFS